MSAAIPVSSIEDAVRDVCRVLEQSYRRVACWPRMTEEALWRELVACILGSRVRFDVARTALARLESANLLSGKRRSSRFEEYERDVLCTLAPTANPRSGCLQAGYPLPKMRANQIRVAAEQIYGKGGTVRDFLNTAGDVREARRCLASTVAGLGPKQASLFLRNIGYAVHVAVLDVHVLTYMNWVGLTTACMKSVSSLRRYEQLEDVFIDHSWAVGYPPDCFDLAVWTVVRVAKKGV